ncbi:hypothetical protein [Galbibacter mesophilus]|uniref:hypothetical protein n=1 Tax=Galbibacter mesophilus TaxID=379069 RepID=UPI00191E92C5|nr:hypothetical protein [Galbibacter mesophilus]MCM5663955.1 hypothetical protein [Galbibacter mesophilus]
MKNILLECKQTNEKCIQLMQQSMKTSSEKKDEAFESAVNNLIELYEINIQLLKAQNHFTTKHCAYCVQETETFISEYADSKALNGLIFMLKKLISDCENVIQNAASKHLDKAV